MLFELPIQAVHILEDFHLLFPRHWPHVIEIVVVEVVQNSLSCTGITHSELVSLPHPFKNFFRFFGHLFTIPFVFASHSQCSSHDSAFPLHRGVDLSSSSGISAGIERIQKNKR